MLLLFWSLFQNTYHSDGHTSEIQNPISGNPAVGLGQEDAQTLIIPTVWATGDACGLDDPR